MHLKKDAKYISIPKIGTDDKARLIPIPEGGKQGGGEPQNGPPYQPPERALQQPRRQAPRRRALPHRPRHRSESLRAVGVCVCWDGVGGVEFNLNRLFVIS